MVRAGTNSALPYGRPLEWQLQDDLDSALEFMVRKMGGKSGITLVGNHRKSL
jgi:hypothetical protein